jgi:hypothetical protein
MSGTLIGSAGFELEIEEDIERELLQAIDNATGGVVEPMMAGLRGVAAGAQGAWYQLVDRETGTHGVIDASLTIEGSTVTMSVGSLATDVGGRGVPVSRVVHKPGPTSTVEITQAASAPLPTGGRIVARKGDKVVVKMPNPKRSDGKGLLVELVERPAREVLDRLIDDGTIARAMQARIDRGGS